MRCQHEFARTGSDTLEQDIRIIPEGRDRIGIQHHRLVAKQRHEVPRLFEIAEARAENEGAVTLIVKPHAQIVGIVHRNVHHGRQCDRQHVERRFRRCDSNDPRPRLQR